MIRILRLVAYLFVLVIPALTSTSQNLLSQTPQNEQWMSTWLLCGAAGVVAILWAVDLLRGKTFWIPVRIQAALLLLPAISPPLWFAVVDPEEAYWLKTLQAFTAMLIMIALGADLFAREHRNNTLRWLSLVVFGTSLVLLLGRGITDNLSVYNSAGVFVAYMLSPFWWGNMPPQEHLVHTSLDFWFGRIGILSEGTQNLRALGLHGLSRARDRRLEVRH